MALNIKNEETHRLIEQLARTTGENMTEAVTEAVREIGTLAATAEEGAGKAPGRDRQRLCAHLKEPYRSVDHGELLYDEKGLPR